MKTGIKSNFKQLLKSPVQFPVETFIGVAFFIMSMFRESLKINDIEWFFVPLIVLTFWLHGINKWLYILSFRQQPAFFIKCGNYISCHHSSMVTLFGNDYIMRGMTDKFRLFFTFQYPVKFVLIR